MKINKTKILEYKRKLEGIGLAKPVRGSFTNGCRDLPRSLSKNHNPKKNGNQNQSGRNLGGSTNRPEIRVHFMPLSNLNANIKNNIPSNNDLVKTNNFSMVKTKEKPGEIKIWANQPAERSPHMPERTLNKDDLSFLDKLIISNLSGGQEFVNGNN